MGGDLANGLTYKVAGGELSDTLIPQETFHTETDLVFPECWKWEGDLDKAAPDTQTSGFIVA